MSLIWMEGWDTYGGSLGAAVAQGLWAEAIGFASVNAGNPRTGSHSLLLSSVSNLTQGARRVFGGEKTAVGIGLGMYMSSLPANSNFLRPIQVLNTGAAIESYIGVHTTGDVSFFLWDNSEIQRTSVPALTAGAYSHLEAKFLMSGTVGAGELRVNEVTVISFTGHNTGGDTTAQMKTANYIPFYPPDTYIDDMFAWDTLTGVDPIGGDIDDFVGDYRVIEQTPVEDGANQDWIRSAGTNSWSLVDEKPSNGDTDYVSTAVAGSKVAVRFAPFDEAVIAVAAIQLDHNTKKTDAGTAFLQMTARTGPGGAEVDGADRPMTTAYTSYFDVFQADPATGVKYTPGGGSAVEAVLERTV